MSIEEEVAPVEKIVEEIPAAITREAQIVMEWFQTHIANSPVSRNTDAVNHLMVKLPELISSLEKKG